jgi:RNA polymerase sigma factor (sigma-70 family)
MGGGPDLDLLLTHSAWVRALARRLVGEGADDLVQEAWVAALARPEVELRTPRAWLAGVLRRLARRTRRGEARRRVREENSARAASGACEPSVEETFEAAATGRALADLVLALEEPFRSVVLLRYYEDLPPRHIAEKLGIPVRTVNSRLERELARLRER